MTVALAVEQELRALGQFDSSLGASALAMASALDDASNSATSRSMCARELRETLTVLRALAAAKREPDKLDDLAARRAKRVAS